MRHWSDNRGTGLDPTNLKADRVKPDTEYRYLLYNLELYPKYVPDFIFNYFILFFLNLISSYHSCSNLLSSKIVSPFRHRGHICCTRYWIGLPALRGETTCTVLSESENDSYSFNEVQSFIQSFNHSIIQSFNHSFIQSFNQSFIHFIHSFIHSFNHSFIHLFIHSFIQSVI